jgi:hypothetical protein
MTTAPETTAAAKRRRRLDIQDERTIWHLRTLY